MRCETDGSLCIAGRLSVASRTAGETPPISLPRKWVVGGCVCGCVPRIGREERCAWNCCGNLTFNLCSRSDQGTRIGNQPFIPPSFGGRARACLRGVRGEVFIPGVKKKISCLPSRRTSLLPHHFPRLASELLGKPRAAHDVLEVVG